MFPPDLKIQIAGLSRKDAARVGRYVEQFLVPTLKWGAVVILYNLGSHKGKIVRRAIRDIGARRRLVSQEPWTKEPFDWPRDGDRRRKGSEVSSPTKIATRFLIRLFFELVGGSSNQLDTNRSELRLVSSN